jgi:hypothetical protein
MFLLHVILPLLIFYFYRNKIMVWGLLLGNLVDLDHIYYRLIGKVEWFESACPELGMQCSWNIYPLHNVYVLVGCIVFGGLVFTKEKRLKFIGWLSLGIALNIVLDLIHRWSGFGI